MSVLHWPRLGIAGFSLCLGFLATNAVADSGGLKQKAERELREAGVAKYLGEFEPVSSEPFAFDWVKHTFDSDGGDGPVCIAGGEYSMFTKSGDPDKVMIFLQGGGACWEGFPRCNPTAEAQFPPPAAFLPGIFADSSADGTIPNDIGDWSVAYFPYCDGSVFGGDNDVENDPVFGVRRHRGLRNLSAGMDVAKSVFPDASQVLVTGSSAGGVGAAGFAPFLARFLFGNESSLYVLNDAGPIALNPGVATAAALARAEDWGFTEFFPKSCVRQGLCDALGQQTGLVEWRLKNDKTVREAFYETDGDLTNIGFASSNFPGTPPVIPLDQVDYRTILDEAHGRLHEKYPNRYKRFVVSGANPVCGGLVAYSHTALQGGNLGSFGCPGIDLFYDLEANGVPLYQWVNDFVEASGKKASGKGREFTDGVGSWVDIVEEFAPAPPLALP